MKNSLLILICLISFLFLPGCTALGLATGAGATAGVAASSEGGIKGTWDDFKIQAKINDLWFRYDIETFRKLDLTVNQGRVLITGVVQNPEARVEAVRLAWQPEGVKQVINEIRVADSEGFMGYAKDKWIATRLRTAITFDRDIQSINYNIDVVQGTVYLMGVAQNQVELSKIIEQARTVSGVKSVVSYVKIAGEPEQAQRTPRDTSYGNFENNTYAPAGEHQSDYHNSTDNSGYTSHQEPDTANEGPLQIAPVEAEPLSSEDVLWDSQGQ